MLGYKLITLFRDSKGALDKCFGDIYCLKFHWICSTSGAKKYNRGIVLWIALQMYIHYNTSKEK